MAIALVTVRFKVGENQERASRRSTPSSFAAMDQAAARRDAAAGQAALDRRRADPDAHPALGGYGSNELRQIAIHLEDEIRTIPDVAETSVIGGQPRQIRVTLDPARLAASGVTPGEVAMALQGANARLQAGEFAAGGPRLPGAGRAPRSPSAADVGERRGRDPRRGRRLSPGRRDRDRGVRGARPTT